MSSPVEYPETSLRPCAYCKGEGLIRSMDCPACRGRGVVPIGDPAEKCRCCQGWGVAGCCRCSVCGGTGWEAIEL